MTERHAQTDCRSRRVIEIIVVENHVQIARFQGQLFASLRYFGDLAIAVIIIKPSSYSFPREIGTSISPVKPQVAKAWIGDFIEIGGHDGEMFPDWAIDIDKDRIVLPQEIDCRF